MGTQCSCTKSKPSTQHQIKHEEEAQTATPPHSDKAQQKLKPTEDKQVKAQISITPKNKEQNKQNIENQNQIIQMSVKQEQEVKIQKVQNKKQKKRVQVMIPTKQLEETNDCVTFIDNEVSKEILNFIVKTLKTHFILSQLSPQEAHYVVTKMRFCKTDKGNYIFKQGDQSFSYYIILQGKCRVQINNQIKKTMEKGSSFGDLGIIYNAPRSASIFAQTDCIFAQLNSKTFKKIINDLNSICQRQNKKAFQQLQFFKQLNDLQKNVLASNCVTEIYQPGQIIFNKGDYANAFYVIQEGIVTILEKKIDLKVGQNVGINVIMSSSTAHRTNTLVAKTYCKLLSLTRDIIHKNLGDNVSNILQKNLISKVLKESDIWEMYTPDQWADVVEKVTITKFAKGDIVFAKNSKTPPFQLHIILSSDARSVTHPKSLFYLANSIIESNKIFKKLEIQFEDDYKTTNQGYLAKILLPKQKAGCNEPNQIVSSALLNSAINFKKIKQINNPSQAPKQTLSMKDFVVVRKLRSGNFGRVYACYNKVVDKMYAIKVMNKQSLISSNVMSYIMKQQELLRTLPQHPFLVKYSTMFRDQNFVLLVQELLEGQDLFDANNQRLPLNQSNCRFLISQIILVLEHLHKNKVIYRDLKPQNVMLKQDGYLTLVDMGTAKKLTMQNRFKTMTIIGTPHYMAPQIILGKGYSFSADWWSLGVMLYEMACGKLPYGQFLQDPFSVYQQVLKGELNFTGNCNSSTKQIITKLLNKNMQKRLKNGCGQLKTMPFFKQMEWEKMLNKQYEANIFPPKCTKISAQQIQKILQKKAPPAIQVFLKDLE